MKSNLILRNTIRGLLILVVLVTLCSGCQRGLIKRNSNLRGHDITVLLLMSNNFGLNYFHNLDIYEEYGWAIVHTGVSERITACPPVAETFNIPPLKPDLVIADIDYLSLYDALIIPPGSGSYFPVSDAFSDLLLDPEALDLIIAFDQKKLPVAATCAGVRVLAASDVIQGKKVVGSPRFQEEYEAAGAVFVGNDHPPLIANNIITSARNVYYSIANGQAIATALENKSPRRGRKLPLQTDHIFSNTFRFSNRDVAWLKTFGGPSADGGRSLTATDDDGFLITGYTFSQGSGDADVLVIKTDSQGTMQWTRTIGGTGTEYGYGSAVVPDGYLIIGYTTSFGTGSKDVYFIKLDKTGQTVWAHVYGGSSWDVGKSVRVCQDGYLLCGFTNSFGLGEEDVYLIKTDFEGKEMWSKTYGGKRSEMGIALALIEDKEILIAANTGTFGGRNSDMYLIKTDLSGNELWTKNLGITSPKADNYDWCNSMYVHDNRAIFLAGNTNSSDLMDGIVFKVDPKGELLWTTSFGKKPFYDYGQAVLLTHDGNLLIAGVTKSIVQNCKHMIDNNIYLVKLDPTGKIIDEKTIGGSESDWAYALGQNKRHETFILGHTNSQGMGSYDVCLVKLR